MNKLPDTHHCNICKTEYAGPDDMECPHCANERRLQAYREDLDIRMTEEARIRDEWRKTGGNPHSYNAMMKKKLEEEV